MLVLFAGCCAFIAATCQGATGFGFALLFVPLLALFTDVKTAVTISVIIGPLAAIPSVIELWPRVHRPVVAGLLAGSLLGMPLGTALLVAASATALRVLVATVVMFATLVTIFGVRIGESRRPLLMALAVGAVSGLLRSATSMGGPPVALYLFGLRYEPRAFVATNASYYLLGSVFAITGLVVAGRVTGSTAMTVAASVPPLLAGAALGGRLRVRLPERAFRGLVILLLLGTSALVLAPLALAALS